VKKIIDAEGVPHFEQLTPEERAVRLYLSHHPGGNLGANLKSILHSCYMLEVAFEWELTKGTIFLPLGCLQGEYIN